MPIPDSITQALAALQHDADALTTAKSDAAAKVQALADAQHASDSAASAVTAGGQQLSSDRAALISLINSTYGS